MGHEVTYKGYSTGINYSEEHKCYQGKIREAESSISFQGSTIDECENEFYHKVDDYILNQKKINFGNNFDNIVKEILDYEKHCNCFNSYWDIKRALNYCLSILNKYYVEDKDLQESHNG